MKLTPNKNDDFNLQVSMESLLGEHLNKLDKFKKGDNQKQLELCQVGKMLATYFPDFLIKQVREVPDFIIGKGKLEIGLEHEIVINSKIQKIHGFFENIFHLVEKDLVTSNINLKVLLNCFLYKNITFSINEKNQIFESLKNTIINYLENGELIKNNLISSIFPMKHTQFNLCPNFGAFMVSDLTQELIQEAINKKERKIESYRNSTKLPQWLLLVAGGANESSYDIEFSEIQKVKITSTFDKVLLFSDFDNELYELT
jgi:hypothetical protein